MDKDVKKIKNMMVDIFSLVEKLEEESVKGSSFENLSLTEVHTLEAIGRGRPRTMTNVASVLGISVSTLTTAINKLVKKGYVERLKDENDKRIVRLRLTDAGVDVIVKHEENEDSLVGEALRRLSKNERARIERVLTEIDSFMKLKAAGTGRRTHLEMDPITIGQLSLPVPIVQAGMSIGVAGEKLAAAVAINGGLGQISLADIGYMEPDFKTHPVQANKRAIKRKVSAARQMVEAAGGKGLIGVNIIWNREYSGEYVKTAIKAGAQAIITSAGMPQTLPKYCADKKVALIPTISTPRAARTITNSWSRKYNRVPDAFILQGPAAAGLLGYKEEQIDFAVQEWQKTILDVKSELTNLEHCPLIVGGGIFDKRDAQTVYRSGADAFLIGSRFVTTDECDAPDAYKQLHLKCTSSDVIIVNSPMKAAVRVMRNPFSQQLAATGSADYDIFKAVRNGIQGDYENGLIFLGENQDRVTRMEKVADVFKEFTE
ncbi:MAG: nitronate monooxygenase [Eubacterium sp.]|nr:nitronate monooxygenase [Candidatus Colimonas fimequi]